MPAQIAENISEAMNFVKGVVVNEGSADDAAALRQAQALHKARRVHMAVADADSGAGCSFGDGGGRDVFQVKANCRHSLMHLCFICDSVNRCFTFPQDPQQFDGE